MSLHRQLPQHRPLRLLYLQVHYLCLFHFCMRMRLTICPGLTAEQQMILERHEQQKKLEQQKAELRQQQAALLLQQVRLLE